MDNIIKVFSDALPSDSIKLYVISIIIFVFFYPYFSLFSYMAHNHIFVADIFHNYFLFITIGFWSTLTLLIFSFCCCISIPYLYESSCMKITDSSHKIIIYWLKHNYIYIIINVLFIILLLLKAKIKMENFGIMIILMQVFLFSSFIIYCILKKIDNKLSARDKIILKISTPIVIIILYFMTFIYPDLTIGYILRKIDLSHNHVRVYDNYGETSTIIAEGKLVLLSSSKISISKGSKRILLPRKKDYAIEFIDRDNSPATTN